MKRLLFSIFCAFTLFSFVQGEVPIPEQAKIVKNYTQGDLLVVIPDNSPLGVPVEIQIRGLPQTPYTKAWIFDPTYPNDKLYELFDIDRKPVNLFWSNVAGQRTYTLIIAENGTEKPSLTILPVIFNYGGDAPPPPLPPLPPTSWQILFLSPDDATTLSIDQKALLASEVIHKELETMGHKILGTWDLTPSDSAEMDADRKTWYQAKDESGLEGPLVEIASVQGGDKIRVFKLPANFDALKKLLKEGHD